MLFKYYLMYIVIFFGLFMTMFFLLTLLEHKHKLKNPKPLKKLPLISLIVPAYNEEKHIAKAIESLRNLEYPKELLEIIVVDDGSTDSTLKVAKRFSSNQVRVYTKKNGGKASAINLGIEKANGEIIGVMDADSFVSKEALGKMVGYFADLKVMAVTPSMKVHSPRGILQRVQAIEYLFGVFLRKVFSFANAINVTPGPFSLYRKEFFDKWGGFDENIITEDMEIAFRIQSKHYKIENSIDAEVFTVSPSKFSELLKQRVRWYNGLIRNMQKYSYLFLNKEYGYLSLLILPSAVVSVGLLIATISYFTYLNAGNLIKTLMNLNSVNFDFLTLMRGFKFEYLYYELTGPLTALLLITLIFHIGLVIFAKMHSNEKSRIKLSYLYYVSFYTYMYVIWWVTAIIYSLFGKVKWKEKEFG